MFNMVIKEKMCSFAGILNYKSKSSISVCKKYSQAYSNENYA